MSQVSTPDITTEHVEPNSISFDTAYGEQLGIQFVADGRRFHIYARDVRQPELLTWCWSYGQDTEWCEGWCLDHDQLPDEVVELIEEHLTLEPLYSGIDVRHPDEIQFKHNTESKYVVQTIPHPDDSLGVKDTDAPGVGR